MGLRRRVPSSLVCFFVVAVAGCSTPTTTADDHHAVQGEHEVHDDHHRHDEGHEEGGGHHHRFEDPQDYVERWNSPERAEWQKPAEVIELMEIEPGMRVVDLGTGTGYFVPHLAEAVGPEGAVVAADIEQSMVDYVSAAAAEQGLENVEARVVPADAPGLQPESVDRVLIVNTWHHIAEREVYAAKLADGLRPGGIVAVVDYTLDAQGGPPKAMRLNPEVVITELEAGGFEATLAEESLPLQYVVIARKK